MPAEDGLDCLGLLPDSKLGKRRGVVNRHPEAPASDGLSEPLENGGPDARETAPLIHRLTRSLTHGRSMKKASEGSFPMVGTTSARSRWRLKRSHADSAI